jgi:hypothetical protein
MGERPSVHKQLLFLPTVVGTMLFVMAGLDISGFMIFVAAFVLLFVTAIPFQYTYTTLFPIQPERVLEAKLGRSVLFFSAQLVFWAGLFVLAGYWRATHGT